MNTRFFEKEDEAELLASVEALVPEDKRLDKEGLLKERLEMAAKNYYD